MTGTGALTVPMLERCLRLNKQIKSAGIKIAEREVTMSQIASEIEQLNSFIDTNSAKVNTTRQDAVDTFNAKINQYSSAVANYNILLDKRNSDFDIYDDLYGRFKQECANKRYYDDDYQKAVKNVGFEMPR
jgi:outer membrane murein-binding lipoprotein Lpp